MVAYTILCEGTYVSVLHGTRLHYGLQYVSKAINLSTYCKSKVKKVVVNNFWYDVDIDVDVDTMKLRNITNNIIPNAVISELHIDDETINLYSLNKLLQHVDHLVFGTTCINMEQQLAQLDYSKITTVTLPDNYNGSIDMLHKVMHLKFGMSAKFNTAPTTTFPNIMTVEFGQCYNQPIDAFCNATKITFPNFSVFNTKITAHFPNIEEVVFGGNFNQSIDCLHQVKKLIFLDSSSNNDKKCKYNCCGPISKFNTAPTTTFPNIMTVEFGRCYNQPIDSFCNATKITFPTFSVFNTKITAYFPNIEEVVFGGDFNQSIDCLHQVKKLIFLDSSLNDDKTYNCCAPIATKSQFNCDIPTVFPNINKVKFGFYFNKPINALSNATVISFCKNSLFNQDVTVPFPNITKFKVPVLFNAKLDATLQAALIEPEQSTSASWCRLQ